MNKINESNNNGDLELSEDQWVLDLKKIYDIYQMI